MANETQTHQVIDFGPGPQDRTLGYPFEGSEDECAAWLDAHQQSTNGRDRFAMQEIPGRWLRP